MDAQQLKDITEKVNLYTLGVLPKPRYEHSMRVAKLARTMGTRFGVDPVRTFLAGLSHDMCKTGRDRWLLSLAARDGLPICDVELARPSLLHGRAAAVLLQSEFGLDDLSVLEAVRHHTFGAAGMDALGKIIFVADKIEPSRPLDAAFRAKLVKSDLDTMTRLILEDNIKYLELKNKEVSPVTRAMLESLRQGV